MRLLYRKILILLFTMLLLMGSHTRGYASAPVLMEWLTESINADKSFMQRERDALLAQLNLSLGSLKMDPLDDINKVEGAEVMMSVIMEGTFDRVKTDHIAQVAARAYAAVRKYGNPRTVEGISLYAFRKKIKSRTIKVWIEGYSASVKYGVPGYLASDLVYQAYKQGWDIRTYRVFRWAQMEAANRGYDQDAFMAYLMEHYRTDGYLPGGVVAKTMQYFMQSRNRRITLEIPAYTGSYLTSSESLEVLKKSRRSGNINLDSVFKMFQNVSFAWGGHTLEGMDNNGFVYSVFLHIGVSLPHSINGIWKASRNVRIADIKKGDLVFFRATQDHITHVGIITDPIRLTFIHVSPTRGVREDSLLDKYFMARFVEARRV